MAVYQVNDTGNVRIGDEYSICHHCYNKYIKENKVLPYKAHEALDGTFAGKKLAVIGMPVGDILLCQDCLKELYCEVTGNTEALQALGLDVDTVLNDIQSEKQDYETNNSKKE